MHVAAKRIVRYPDRTGDLFAPAVALAMCIGRIGCLLTERPGTPTGQGWGIVLTPDAAARVGSPAGVPLHPSFVYEIAFHAAAFALLWFWLRHRPIAAGETLTLYIAAYGLFRFFVEFVRGNEIAWVGFTRPQLFLMVTIPILLVRIAVMARRGAFGAGARQAEASTPAASAAPTPVQGSDRREQPA
ncbi:MAG: prolipoprotein diacylglyceryl transferase [Microbacterium sp.]